MIAFSSALLSMLFLVSLWLTGRVRRYALRHNMLDRPNERSSHETPTPRGGGLGFSVLILASLGVLLVAFPDSRNVWIGLLGGGEVTELELALVELVPNHRQLLTVQLKAISP